MSIFNGLDRAGLQLVMSVQENAAVAMADGYARFRGTTGVLLYMMPGVATAMSNLYNAWRDETPLLVVVSQLASRSRRGQAHVGEADLNPLLSSIGRYVREAAHQDQLSEVMGAAACAAAGPPTGPAFAVIPEDMLVASVSPAERVPASTGKRGVVSPRDVTMLVEQLRVAERPTMIVGGQLRRSGGSEAAEALAAQLAIPILFEPFWNDRLGVSPAHSCVVGQLTEGTSLAAKADAVLALGCRLVNEVHPRLDAWFSAARLVAHVNADAVKLGQSTPVSWSCAADPGATAVALLEELQRQGPVDAHLLERRRQRISAAQDRRRVPRPGPYTEVVQALAGELDAAFLVDESVSANAPLMAALRSSRGERYVSTTGGSLGWSIGASCGVALATGEPVTCAVGDGAFFFGCQGLWPAVAASLPITFVVIDNGGFGSTQWFEEEFLNRYPADQRRSPTYAGSDFLHSGPSPTEVAKGFGLPAETILAEDLAPRLQQLRGQGPHLVRVPVGTARDHYERTARQSS